MDPDKRLAHSAINKDGRISPKATLLRRAVREQQCKVGAEPAAERTSQIAVPSPTGTILQGLSTEGRASGQSQGPRTDRASDR